jgi:hypothetical protein
MEQIIWNELYRLKYHERYLSLYLDVIKDRRKWFQIVMLLFSTGGVMGWALWEYAPIIGAGVASIVQIVSLFHDRIVMSDADMGRVMDLRMLHISVFNRMERLWVEMKEGKAGSFSGRFYDLRNEMADIHQLDNRIDLPTKRRIIAQASIQAKQYLEDYFISSAVAAEGCPAEARRG